MTTVREHAEGYLRMRRSLGYSLHDDGRTLLDFVAFLEHNNAEAITTELAVAWTLRTRPDVHPAHWNRRLSIVRVFARHLRALEPATEIPPENLMRFHRPRAVPYLYTPQQIQDLIAAAAAIRHSVKAATFPTLIGLLAVTGMRVGEACGLDRTDVDLAENVLSVRDGKFGKDRQVPIHTTATAALAAYSRRRDELAPRATTPAFFINAFGRRLSTKRVDAQFIELREAAGIRPAAGIRAPRIHDLRHSFCVRTMLNWYRDGVDVQAQLPLLSTYLGHVDPVSTYWYLQAAPELMALAADRLETFLGPLP